MLRLLVRLISLPFRYFQMSDAERTLLPSKIKGLRIQQTNRLKGFFQNPDPVQVYVGSTVQSARLQFTFLQEIGLKKNSKVLEVGCGALHASRYLIDYLNPGHYVGIDPNSWLREYSVSNSKHLADLIDEKKPMFIENTEFDASEIGFQFDYILSHSVLSHAAHAQLEQFLMNTSRVLANEGKILASIRLAEGNQFGSEGAPDGKDSLATEWVYPGVSYFTRETIEKTAGKFGLTVTYREDFTRKLTSFRKPEFHDWIEFSRS